MRRFQCFRISRQDHVTVLELLPPTSGFRFSGSALTSEIAELARDEQPAHVMIDLGHVTCNSTEVINSLLIAKRVISEHGGQVVLCGVSSHLYQSLCTLRLAGAVLPICEKAEGNGRQGTERAFPSAH